MKYELVFQIFQILVFQILAYLSIYHVSGMVSVSVWYRLKKAIPILQKNTDITIPIPIPHHY